MSSALRVRDGDFVGSYKEFHTNSLIAFGIWKAKYPKAWIAAGGGTLTLNGREYFGNGLRLDSLGTPALEEFALLNGFDMQEIRKLQAKSQVKHVDIKFTPQQTFTNDGLDYYFSNVLKPELEALGTVSLVLEHELIKNTIEEVQTAHSFKRAASSLNYTFQTNQKALEVVYVVSAALDSYSTVDHAIYGGVYSLALETWTWEIYNPDNVAAYDGYKGETRVTIALDNFDFLSSLANDVYDIVYLGDKMDDYYLSDAEFGYFYDGTIAGYLWTEEFQYVEPPQWVAQQYYASLDGLVLYHDGHYYIDLQMWKSASPKRCIIALGRLMYIKVVQDEGFFGIPIIGGMFKALLEGLNAVVRLLGISVYIAFWFAGLWTLDFAANYGLISKKDLDKFKEISYEVMGNAALIVLTWGASSSITTLDYISAGVQLIGAGVGAEAQYRAEHTNTKEYTQESEEQKQAFDFTYSDEINGLYVADTFYDYYDEVLDPYFFME